MATDYTEKITSIEEQIAQLKNRQRELMQKHKSEERKARTKRLIERGAIAESLIESADEMTNDQFKAFIENAFRQGGARQAPAPKPTDTEQETE